MLKMFLCIALDCPHHALFLFVLCLFFSLRVSPDNPGINQLAIEKLFSLVEERPNEWLDEWIFYLN